MMAYVTRPDVEKADAFLTYACDDPDCGLHLVAVRRDNTPICEIVICREALRNVLRVVHEEGLDL